MAVNKIKEIELERILPNPFQPRKSFNKEKIEELANSIKKVGLLQPIIVNLNNKNEIKLIAGQRRLEACKLLNKKTIECIILVGNATEKDFRQASIIENIQREEMSSYETSLSIKELYDSGMTQEDIGEQLGKSVSWVNKMLAINNLDEQAKEKIENGSIEISKASIIASQKNLSNEEKNDLINEVISNKVSKKDLEEKVKNKVGEDFYIQEQEICLALENKYKVSIKNNKLIINFKNLDQLNQIVNLFKR
ncbi:ParB/RepB/Spo0J family partition protein [Spiroplasma floricola]|uniref:Chromosome partitioning protein ParB n=1 Tax=Spiroplasma floricola 23-6 TaxID=1336749 RepID=A0A2K8SF20_9MOLU|nr:ParB/RepB/Spo0J family partition protein [Spiroplasma floricola]AUB32036.1 chromosome partitioning protein ParB [Spiroplasma floricola 23-6]